MVWSVAVLSVSLSVSLSYWLPDKASLGAGISSLRVFILRDMLIFERNFFYRTDDHVVMLEGETGIVSCLSSTLSFILEHEVMSKEEWRQIRALRQRDACYLRLRTSYGHDMKDIVHDPLICWSWLQKLLVHHHVTLKPLLLYLFAVQGMPYSWLNALPDLPIDSLLTLEVIQSLFLPLDRFCYSIF